MLRQIMIITTLGLTIALAQAQAVAAEAGKVIFASGQAQVAGKAGAEGTSVDEGELLSTGADGFLYVKTIDNGLFILRPNTKARIVAYRVDRKNPANTQVKLELISGVARSKSGDAVKQARQNFRFNTPVAAIGVRGTDFTVYTDQDTSRVAVLTGGVVVSGFAGACRPEGGGPCEGAASRELFAAQRGQLIEVTLGAAAPKMVPTSSISPDQVSPPRSDEPVARSDQGNTTPILDARKSDTLDKLVSQQPDKSGGVTPGTKPPVTTQPQPDPVTPQLPGPDAGGGTDVPVVPSMPERAILWGRWANLAGNPGNIELKSMAGADSIIGGDYVIYRTAGREFVAPERGSASFALKGGEATIRHDNAGRPVEFAQVNNGKLNVDFGKATFDTSFNVVTSSETFRMIGEGAIAKDGRFANDGQFVRPATNNMSVNGVLSNADGGSAAYVFRRRIEERDISGVTFWNK
jgi:hypothetical protein